MKISKSIISLLVVFLIVICISFEPAQDGPRGEAPATLDELKSCLNEFYLNGEVTAVNPGLNGPIIVITNHDISETVQDMKKIIPYVRDLPNNYTEITIFGIDESGDIIIEMNGDRSTMRKDWENLTTHESAIYMVDDWSVYCIHTRWDGDLSSIRY